jgi:hypothetical protein
MTAATAPMLKHRTARRRHPPRAQARRPGRSADQFVKATVRGIRRTVGAGQVRKAPATADKIVTMVTVAPRADLKGLVALDVADLEFCDGGLRVHIRRSKTDQEGAGATIAIVPGSIACPVQAVKAWLDAASITTGPVFRAVDKGRRQPDHFFGLSQDFAARCCRLALDFSESITI